MTALWIAICGWLGVLAVFVVLRARATGQRLMPHRQINTSHRWSASHRWSGHRR